MKETSKENNILFNLDSAKIKEGDKMIAIITNQDEEIEAKKDINPAQAWCCVQLEQIDLYLKKNELIFKINISSALLYKNSSH